MAVAKTMPWGVKIEDMADWCGIERKKVEEEEEEEE